jgi:hypothetical protein
MIAIPPGWRTLRGEHGLILTPIGGAGTVVEYVEVVRPLAEIAAVVDAVLARDPRFQVDAIAAPERLVTNEGELGALAIVDGHVDDRPARRAIGVTFADDHFALTSGLALEPDQRAALAGTVRALVIGDCHMLGVRRRPFRYEAPVGWRAHPRGFHETAWRVPGAAAAITVWPAWPLGNGSPDDVAALVEGAASSPEFTIAQRVGPRPAWGRSGLEGRAWDFVGTAPGGRAELRAIAVLHDHRYVYPSRLEVVLDGPTPGHREAFLALVASIEPIPLPLGSAAAAPDGQVFSHWRE